MMTHHHRSYPHKKFRPPMAFSNICSSLKARYALQCRACPRPVRSFNGGYSWLWPRACVQSLLPQPQICLWPSHWRHEESEPPGWDRYLASIRFGEGGGHPFWEQRTLDSPAQARAWRCLRKFSRFWSSITSGFCSMWSCWFLFCVPRKMHSDFG